MATQLHTPDPFETARSLGVSISLATPIIGAGIGGLERVTVSGDVVTR